MRCILVRELIGARFFFRVIHNRGDNHDVYTMQPHSLFSPAAGIPPGKPDHSSLPFQKKKMEYKPFSPAHSFGRPSYTQIYRILYYRRTDLFMPFHHGLDFSENPPIPSQKNILFSRGQKFLLAGEDDAAERNNPSSLFPLSLFQACRPFPAPYGGRAGPGRFIPAL